MIRRIRVTQHLAGTAAFAVDQHRVPDPGVGGIQGDEILIRLLARGTSGCTTSSLRFL